MAGFKQPSKREMLVQQADEKAEVMRGALEEAYAYQARNPLARTAEVRLLLAVAFGIDAVLARLELMTLSDDDG